MENSLLAGPEEEERYDQKRKVMKRGRPWEPDSDFRWNNESDDFGNFWL